MNENQLYLIDGHALVYRAYFAFSKNPLINSKGQPTGAVFGFANYLLRLIENYACPYLAVVLDSSTPTFRHQMYTEYKANREAMPDELKSQMPIILKLIQALNIPVIREDGLEADDLIAMLTRKALDHNFNVFLVTKDKDLMQLIGPNVKMLAPDGSGTLQLLGVNEVIEKMGVGPEKIVDYLALIGDSSDNIPGVPGVGPKTAVKILQTAGSVDLILENPSILGNEKLISKIEENRELLRISKMLATLKYDSESDISIDSLQRKPVNRTDCIALFRELEFTSLVRHPLFSGASRQTFVPTVVTTDSQLDQLIGQLSNATMISISTLTSDSVPRSSRLTGIAISISKSDAFFIPLWDEQCLTFLSVQTVLGALKPIIESPDIKKIGHNLKFKYQVFKNYGIQMDGICFDTMIAAYLIDSGKKAYELDILASEILNVELSFRADLSGNFLPSKDISALTDEKKGEFAAEQACVQFSLMEELCKKLDELNTRSLFDTIEIPLIKVLADLEWEGILVDTKLLNQLSTEYGAVLKEISDDIYKLAGGPLNINSPKQVGEVLFEKLMLPGSKKTKTGGYSTNVDVLEKLAPDYPIVQKILDYRELQKLLSTYIDALPAQIQKESGRVHTSFNQTIAATGRLSSTNPNLQNIPVRTEMGKRIREAFITSPGNVLISADYSQIELRILADLSNDPFLIQAFIEDKDIHTLTASAIYGVFPEMVSSEMRRAAKTINFGLMYGMGPINLSRQLGISFGEAKKFIDSYFQQFPTIKQYMESTIENVRKNGFAETLLGRRRYLPEINASNRIIREAAERVAINTPVQGTAADIIKIAMIKIHQELPDFNPSARMLLQVHDELVFEAPEESASVLQQWIIDKMSSAYTIKVPLKVDAGIASNWSMAH